MTRRVETLAERIARSVSPPTSTGCVEWQGSTMSQGGYGQFKLQGTWWAAHRAAWTVANGPIPDGLFVLHRCENPPCVNPEHLFLGTHIANMHDRNSKGRHPWGTANGHAKLDADRIAAARVLHAAGWTHTQIGDLWSVHNSVISRALSGESYRPDRWSRRAEVSA